MKKILLFLIIVLTMTAYAQFDNRSQQQSSMFAASAISITIGGDFIVTGSFPALITERVDQFITRVFNEARQEALSLAVKAEQVQKISEKIDEYSLRDITLIRNGEKIKLDLLKFRRTGDFSHNPYLKNDDVIVFPPKDIERNFFSIGGAVNTPGKFNFVEGDNLIDALELANGVNPAYENVTSADIYRLNYSGEEMSKITVDINSSTQLQRGDRIIVAADETQRKSFSALVVGEVKAPGAIPITKNNSTLKEVIERAGGLTASADLNRARVYSGTALLLLLEKQYGIKVKETPEILDTELNDAMLELEKMMMFRMSNITLEDTTYFFLENQIRVLTEGSSVDFSQLTDSSSDAANYKIKDDDIIIIPQKINGIYVFGQVTNPGYVAFEDGRDYKYFINKAGGLGELAEDEIMVIKGGSRSWIDPEKNYVALEPGDYIYVPKDQPRSFNYYVQRFGTYLGIVGSAATIILLLIQFNK